MGSIDKTKPSVRVDRLAFAAPSMDFEVIAEVFIPIHIRRGVPIFNPHNAPLFRR
jgi:hypothetical protein